MKRWPIVLLISLAVVVFLSPGIIGHLAEKSLDENLNWLEAENDDIVISTEKFDRGWFSSAGQHRVTIKEGSMLATLTARENPAQNGLPSLIIDTRLDHGVFPLTSLARDEGTLKPSIASSVSTLKIDPGDGALVDLPGTIYSTIGLTGKSRFHYVMDAGSQRDDHALVTWTGANITVDTTPANRSFSARGEIEPVTLESYGTVTEVGPVTFGLSQEESPFAFAVGTVKLGIDFLTVTRPGETQAGFGKLRLDAVNELDGDRVNARTIASVTRALVPGIGPMTVNVDFAAKGIDAKSLEGLISALRDAQGGSLAGSGQAQITPLLQAGMQQLIAHGLEARFSRFDISLPQGDLSTTITVTVPESDPNETFSWPGIILATTASINLTLSTSLYEMMQTMNPEITSLVAMGVLKRNGGQYATEIQYAKGLLTINGAPMAIPLGMLQ